MKAGAGFNGFFRCPNCRNIHTLFGEAPLNGCHDCNTSFQDEKEALQMEEYQSSSRDICESSHDYLNRAKESSHRRIVSWDYRKPPPFSDTWTGSFSTSSTFDAGKDECKSSGGRSDSLYLLAGKRNISGHLSTNTPPDFKGRWKPLFRKLLTQEQTTASQRQFGQPLHYQPPPRKQKNDSSSSRDKLRRHYMPISGGVNFILCYRCLSLLEIPKSFQFSEKKTNKMRCGNPQCSKILSFSFCRGTHVILHQHFNNDTQEEDLITPRIVQGYTHSAPTLGKMIGRYSARDILFELSPDGTRVEMISAKNT